MRLYDSTTMIKTPTILKEQIEFYHEVEKEMMPIFLSFLQDVPTEIEKRGLPQKVDLDQVTEIVLTMPELYSRIEALGTKVNRSPANVIQLFFAMLEPNSPISGMSMDHQLGILLLAMCNKVYAV